MMTSQAGQEVKQTARVSLCAPLGSREECASLRTSAAHIRLSMRGRIFPMTPGI